MEVIENMTNIGIVVNDQETDTSSYEAFHKKRVALTLRKLREIGAKKIVEVGGHPWFMTAELIDDPQLQLCATVSAEELTNWPDDIGVTTRNYRIKTRRGNEKRFTNHSANIERTLFDIDESPDTVIACEIVEHLVRSPHVLFLNINRWLSDSGRLLITTPNGAQFHNPFRRKSPTPPYRSSMYERHSYLYTIDKLIELISLCGFRVLEADYWNPYEIHGLPKIYDVLSRLPLMYFRDKFKKTICIVAEKEHNRTQLEKLPSAYDPRGDWEFVQSQERS